MGWDGLRVCLWGDFENSDKDGNLVNNDHLDLMDYLIAKASERGIWGIGVDVDQSHLGSHILTSAVMRLDMAVFDTIEELARGTLETGRTSRFSLRNDGVGLGAINPAVPRALLARIEGVRAEIVDGKIPIAGSVT